MERRLRRLGTVINDLFPISHPLAYNLARLVIRKRERERETHMRAREHVFMCVCVHLCVCRVHTRERVSIFFVSDTSTLSTSRNRLASACDTWILSFFWVHDAVSTVSMFAASWNRISNYSQVERMTGLWVTSAAPCPCVVTVLTRYCVTSTWLRARSK